MVAIDNPETSDILTVHAGCVPDSHLDTFISKAGNGSISL